MKAHQTQPLAGVRVLDMTHDWAGPHATRVLGDYGAEVIKIEYPGRLCGMRGAYLENKDRHPRWWEINRNKRAVTLDLHLPEHVEAAKALIRTSDVIVDNSRPGVMERFGLGYETARVLRPDIVFVAMSAHGASGPESAYAGYGGAIEALSGAQSLTAYEAGSEPLRVREFDVTNGVMGACAVMTALIHRQQTGEGQYVDLAQREASTWLIGEHVLEFSANHTQQLPVGNRHPQYAPQGCYRALGDDRWVVLTIRSDAEWQQLCEAMGRPEWAYDPRFATLSGRRAHHDEIDGLIQAWTAQSTPQHVVETLQARGLAVGMVATVADLASDPHLRSRSWFQPSPVEGEAEYPGFPFRFAHGGGRLERRGADLGADNRAVLCQRLGWRESDLPPLADEHLGTAFDVE